MGRQPHSLGEQIERALPEVKVVKAFVTQEQATVVNPKSIGGGDHTMFVAGEDTDAKQQVTDLLKSYGWSDVLDLGPLVAARGMEMYPEHTKALFDRNGNIGPTIWWNGSWLSMRRRRSGSRSVSSRRA
ncbi:hypothetical protein [Streptomyces sp. NPDC053048]|uniref:hypothetical protein n=1 Tax=Streptomyces sp. NPDC053048 TaxID=3365694 RepID=UPI0037CE0CD1